MPNGQLAHALASFTALGAWAAGEDCSTAAHFFFRPQPGLAPPRLPGAAGAFRGFVPALAGRPAPGRDPPCAISDTHLVDCHVMPIERRDSSALLTAWHGAQIDCRFAGSSSPPSNRGRMWSTSDALATMPDLAQTWHRPQSLANMRSLVLCHGQPNPRSVVVSTALGRSARCNVGNRGRSVCSLAKNVPMPADITPGE